MKEEVAEEKEVDEEQKKKDVSLRRSLHWLNTSLIICGAR